MNSWKCDVYTQILFLVVRNDLYKTKVSSYIVFEILILHRTQLDKSDTIIQILRLPEILFKLFK